MSYLRFDKLNHLRFWCQKVLPLVYDDSLSYYELLCKIVDYLNKTVDGINQLTDAFIELQNYVNNYLDTVEFQQMVNDKLDKMLESGALADVIANFAGAVKWYADIVSASASDAPLGSTIAVDGETYSIEANDNGYGFRTVNGWAVPANPNKKIDFVLNKQIQRPLVELVGNADYNKLQGSGYNSTNNRFAYIIQNDDNQSCFVQTDVNGEVISRKFIYVGHGNDIAWVPERGSYLIPGGSVGNGTVYEVNAEGNVIRSFATLLPTGWPSSIAYDDVHQRVIIWSNNSTIYVLDTELNILHDVGVDDENYYKLVPNSNPYTAFQGGFCYKGNFFMTSSVFFADGYRKCVARVTQFDTVTGEAMGYFDYLFNVTGTEQESVIVYDDKIILNGYTNTGNLLMNIYIGESAGPFDGKLNNTSATRIFYANNTVDGDGLSPSTPTNSMQNAVWLAANYPNSQVCLLTNCPETGEIHVKSNSDITFVGVNVGNDGTISYSYKEAACRFIVEGTGRYTFTSFTFTHTGETAVEANGARLSFEYARLRGTGNTQNSAVVRATHGSIVSAYHVEIENVQSGFVVTDASVFVGYHFTGTGAERIVNCSFGSIATIDTAHDDTITGFVRAGYESGGKIIFTSIGNVEFPTTVEP